MDIIFDVTNEAKWISRKIFRFSSKAEQEVERLLKVILPDSPFKGLVKAVGGYVRDQYLSIIKNDPTIEADDLDLVIDQKDGAEKLTHYIFDLLKNESVSSPHQMGKDYPIWQLTFKNDTAYKGEIYKTKGAVIDFADTMKETYPDPSSRQRITMPANLKEDIARRDFSVNMLLKDMTTGEIEDFTGRSKNDIEKGILRGHPEVSMDKIFEEDPLRMIRLIRFQAKYGWEIPLEILRSVRRKADRIKIISSERIMKELKKIMEMGKLNRAIKLMSVTGLLKHIFPEVEALKGTKQRPEYHGEGDVYRHTLMVLKEAPPGLENQMAALLHDIGKPATTELIKGQLSSSKHDDVGAEIAEAIMRRLKFENAAIDKVKTMVKNHMRPHHLGPDATPKAIRKFVRDVGDEMVNSVLDLARADELGKIPATHDIPDLRKRIDEIRNKIEIKKKPILNGHEIMQLLGIPSGPEVGQAEKILIEIEDEYSDQNKILTKEDAKEELLQKFHKGTIMQSNNESVINSILKETKIKKAIDFPTEEAMKKYFEEHPNADPSWHRVVRKPSPEDSRHFQY